MSYAKDQLVRLLRDKAYSEGDIVLSSGKQAKYYIDGKLVTYDPLGATLVGEWIAPLIREYGVEAVGGLTMGADPIATATAIASQLQGHPLPAFIVRKVAKPHGLKKWIEGPPLTPGMRVAIVDDVITSGGSVIEAITRVVEAQCTVAVVACLVDREEGGREAIEAMGCDFHAACTVTELRSSGKPEQAYAGTWR